LNNQLQFSRPKKNGEKKGKKEVSINNIDFSSPTLKTATFRVANKPVKALVDTGSTHCLMSVKTFQKFKNLPFTPLKVHMKVAGSVLHDNVIGSTICCSSFTTKEGEVTIPLTFLIAHALNGYESILGATLLMNPEMTSAITPTHLCLTSQYNNSNIALETVKKKMQGNFMTCEEVTIPPGVTTNILARISPPFSDISEHGVETATVSGNYTILDCVQTSLDTVQCTVKNSSDKSIRLCQPNHFGLAFENQSNFHASETNSLLASEGDKNAEPEFSDAKFGSESIDEQIIAEHQLFDPSDLDKKFKYTDCEINPNLKPELREKLDKIIFDNQTVFAKTKLDVGKFPDFTVSLDIDAEIPAEKQRFMSEEKLAYCERTFDEFEKLGLVQECHSPKTVSNLLLVPKYEGLRGPDKSICVFGSGERRKEFFFQNSARSEENQCKNEKCEKSISQTSRSHFSEAEKQGG
jgi:hypothetical protein